MEFRYFNLIKKSFYYNKMKQDKYKDGNRLCKAGLSKEKRLNML